jgi:NAD-dependent SIR2 family protein deacetylase
MRFLADGADIPDELIRTVADGNAVFLCGAGVSLRANMPSFCSLTEQVYKMLRETTANEPVERIAFERKEYDRALRSLEKRTHRPQTVSRVRVTVAQLLTAPDSVEVPDRLVLLQLSRDNEGRFKLMTTNFDTLFERAAHAAGLTNVPSHAAKSIPKPGGARDHGILHLHGRIADTKLGLEETDLVLTSADFGDAYLLLLNAPPVMF